MRSGPVELQCALKARRGVEGNGCDRLILLSSAEMTVFIYTT